MSVIYIILPLALVLAALGVAAFIWAVRGGQYDDMDTPSIRALHDDDPEPRTDDDPSPNGERENAGRKLP